MYHILPIHSLVVGHLGCFQFLAIPNNAAMNMVEHMSLLYENALFGCIPKKGMAGSWGRLIPIFLSNRHTDFQSGFRSSHSHQQWKSVPISPRPLNHRIIIGILDFSHSDRSEVVSQCCFKLHFSDGQGL